MPDKDTVKDTLHDAGTPETSDAPSPAVENFLKAIYTLQQSDAESPARVSTNALSEHLGKTAPSITDMAQRMTAAGLVDYKRHHGVVLTAAGATIALRVLRRHRLIELYLVTELGYELRDVHNEAERLEHAVSDRFVEAIARKLGNPDFDPHGDPIPAADGSITTRALLSLADLPADTPAVVRRLKAGSPEMLQYVLDRGFHLLAPVQVTGRDPFDGPITVLVEGQSRAIGQGVAGCILVEPVQVN
ncbi:MAG: metal-dependent transcriptional regulator [Chloroflexota bacterium]|nr:metal-dependent transcriptional regulator [Chloroflexota bacterium]